MGRFLAFDPGAENGPLMTSEPGSFARSTIVERTPQIIQQIIRDNDYPPEIVEALQAFQQEIAGELLQPLQEMAPDSGFWNQEIAAYQDRSWLELPWYLAEAYFYRRLLEAVRYLAPGPWQGRDPFGKQKRVQEQEAASWLAKNWQQLAGAEALVKLEALLLSSLWGNRADLSNLAVREQATAGLAARQERGYILIDDTEEVVARLAAGLERVDFVNDNTGRELLFDLALADFLLAGGLADKIVFHLKDRPFFVSDAMPQDVHALLALVRPGALGRRLDEHLTAGRLVLKDNPFWTRCLMFYQMPPALGAELARSDLVVLKGDVNYRRLLGDRHWPHTARIEEIAAYFPAPLLVLRTLKGEIMVGLKPEQAERLAAQDSDWLINGKRGIVQFVNKSRFRPSGVGQ